MGRRLVLLVLITTVWLMGGCRDQPSPISTKTSPLIQPADTLESTKVLPTPTPTEGRPTWLPVPPENPTIIRFTDNTEWDNVLPVWSPDGNQIVFLSNRECVKPYIEEDWDWDMIPSCQEWDLYLMDVDGSIEIRLTDVQFRDSHSGAWLGWSPDGKWIAFTYSNYFDLPFERVLSFSPDKAKQAPLGLEDMEVLVEEGEDYQVSSFEWSPDGRKYVYGYYQFWADTDDSWYVVVVDEDSGEEVFRKTTTGETKCKFRAWSPNGEAILVQCVQELDWEYQLDLVDLNTGNQRLLIDNAIEPAWSPNGRWILYTSTETGLAELFHVQSEEVIPIEVPDDIYFLYIWSWSPDGKWVTYDKIESNGIYSWSNIYLMDMSWLEMEWEEE
jgi:Tol biopolymer transport system component